MSIPEKIQKTDLLYELPESQIAKHPVTPRDSSKLLIYKEKQIEHRIFRELPEVLDSSFTLFFNNTKVIPARLFFQKETGAIVEIFLLNPIKKHLDIAQVMSENQECSWACKIGKLKRIKSDTILKRTEIIEGKTVNLTAEVIDREQQYVTFQWDNSAFSFAEILENFGVTPLPPYLKRSAENSDKTRYQTVYSKHEGAVAAPTAGLHFTPEVLQNLENKGINLDYLTLHVSGGTFQPVQHENVIQHPMHSEQVVVSLRNIDNLLQAQKVVAIGTTSMRTLESLYWFGVKLSHDFEATFWIEKLFPYQNFGELPSLEKSLKLIKTYMIKKGFKKLHGSTEIMIMPTYRFRVCKALITNFHLPNSTLILLVSAFIGQDWRKTYQEALKKEYRFLSFGDSSLLFLPQKTVDF